jgi:hypothetical protein
LDVLRRGGRRLRSGLGRLGRRGVGDDRRIEVNNRTATDPRITDLQTQVSSSAGAERAALNARLAEVQTAVRTEKLGQVAAEFDRVHSIQRAVDVGSVDAIIRAAELRPRIIEALQPPG